MKTFIFKNGRPDHQEGYHDDLLMSLAMCLWVLEHSFKKLERLEKQNKAILNSWLGGAGTGSTSTTTVLQRDELTGRVTKTVNQQHPAYKNVQDPRGQFSWLFAKPR
jgi:hypothetical protein